MQDRLCKCKVLQTAEKLFEQFELVKSSLPLLMQQAEKRGAAVSIELSRHEFLGLLGT